MSGHAENKSEFSFSFIERTYINVLIINKKSILILFLCILLPVKLQGCTKLRNEIETKRNEILRNATKYTKMRNETKYTKMRNGTKRNILKCETKRNETEFTIMQNERK